MTDKLSDAADFAVEFRPMLKVVPLEIAEEVLATLEQRVERLEFAARQALMAIEEGYDAPKIRDDLRQALKETT